MGLLKTDCQANGNEGKNKERRPQKNGKNLLETKVCNKRDKHLASLADKIQRTIHKIDKNGTHRNGPNDKKIRE